ncbi:MAG: ribosome recycling factor [Clostridiales bacterium]|jgi:ribosome recycling factor|nr:ribosome recycling factor [Clostridiales bacterium]
MQPYESKMQKALAVLSEDLGSIRAGRANPHVLDKITVNYYGTDTPLNQVGNVSAPEPRLIVIQPWEKNLLKAIEKAIQASDIGINPSNDGSAIRLVFPDLTEERRKTLAKEVKKKGDEYKVAVRNIRRDGNDEFKKRRKKSEITEDEMEEYEGALQKLTDKYIADIDKIVEAKTADIMSI